jgi:oligoribonuclease
MAANENTPAGDATGNLIWIDLEMTGLDTTADQIIEIATVVTDANLNQLAVGPVIAVRQSMEVMEGMDAWNTRQHGQSGLTERVLQSEFTAADAQDITIRFLEKHVSAGESPMCGNSICQDRRFLARQMPSLEAYFHYRNLDVSTLKILANLWTPAVASGFQKESSHTALADIRDSIAELAYYRENLFVNSALAPD